MTRCSRPLVISLLFGAAALSGRTTGAQTPQPVQTFRTGTEVVLVDVSVREGGRPVAGLGPESFVLTDNGVRQRIESVERTAVPIDLTLVVDVSGGSSGRIGPRRTAAKVESDVRSEVARIASALRPEDRMRALAIDRHVQLVTPMASPASPLVMKALEFDGIPALYDALAAALLYPSEPARRHVVIARTRGEDTISAVDAQALREIAERSDALFHLVLMETALDNGDALAAFQCHFMGFCWPARQFWVPFRRRLVAGPPMHRLMPDGTALAAAVEATGGGLHKATGLTVPTLVSTFERTFEDFRSGYLLRYTPQGVDRGGWHQIDVKVPASGRYTVRSRRGYAVEAATVVSSPAALPEVPQALTEFTSAYEQGAYQQVATGLRGLRDPLRLLREFEDGGNPWPARPRREAAFAIELADPGLFSSDADTRDKARALLERFTRLVRHPLEPDTFERYWHFAVLTLLEGAVRPGISSAFVDRALERFPDEPRFILSRAIVSEQQWGRAGGRSGTGDQEKARDVEAVLRNYEAAVIVPETAIEARIRSANLLHRIDRNAEALAQLPGAGVPIEDPYLRYLRHLVQGSVLAALDRLDESVAAYRGALQLAPTAQAARVGLMNALLLHGNRVEAEALAQQIQADHGDDLDPWWVYSQGQYRLHPQALARIREMSR